MSTTTTKRVADTGSPGLSVSATKRVADTGLPSLAVSATKRVAAFEYRDHLVLETTGHILLEGDMTDGDDYLLLEGDMQTGSTTITKRVADTGSPGLYP